MYANVETVVLGVKNWLEANLQSYVDLATADGQSEGYLPPELKKVAVRASIPETGPFPFLAINQDTITSEPAAQGTQAIKVQMLAMLALNEQKPEKLAVALMRYTDAFIKAIGEHYTLDGLVDELKIERISKDELDGKGFLVVELAAKIETIDE